MSCFVRISTVLTDLDTLERVVPELGYRVLEGATTVRGYGGQTRAADLVIDTGSRYDIGVVRTDEGTLDFVSDWEMSGIGQQDFVHRVSQRYARTRVLQQAKRQGYVVAKERVDADGSVRLLLRRFA